VSPLAVERAAFVGDVLFSFCDVIGLSSVQLFVAILFFSLQLVEEISTRRPRQHLSSSAIFFLLLELHVRREQTG
jgi:hypothetical protein